MFQSNLEIKATLRDVQYDIAKHKLLILVHYFCHTSQLLTQSSLALPVIEIKTIFYYFKTNYVS